MPIGVKGVVICTPTCLMRKHKIPLPESLLKHTHTYMNRSGTLHKDCMHIYFPICQKSMKQMCMQHPCKMYPFACTCVPFNKDSGHQSVCVFVIRHVYICTYKTMTRANGYLNLIQNCCGRNKMHTTHTCT